MDSASANGRDRRFVLVALVAYALAMALVETAIVVHLRHLYYADRPLRLFPLRLLTGADLILELGRELATLIMIGTVALLAERQWSRRFAAFLLVFGVWDLGYYAWLKVFLDWPQHWLEWDLLFLIPWPWLGPWIAPALIALVFSVWGSRVVGGAQAPHWTRTDLALLVAGASTSLACFLFPAWPFLRDDESLWRTWIPAAFNWPAFAIGVAIMGMALIRTCR